MPLQHLRRVSKGDSAPHGTSPDRSDGVLHKQMQHAVVLPYRFVIGREAGRHLLMRGSQEVVHGLHRIER